MRSSWMWLSALVTERIEEHMRAIVNMDEPFEKKDVPMEEANKIFLQQGLKDKVEVMKYRKEDTMNLYQCGDVIDYLYGYMVPSTGYLKKFGLKFYLPGVILQYPSCEDPIRVRPFQDNPKLFTVFRLAEKWSAAMNSQCGRFEQALRKGGFGFDSHQRAYQEKQIGAIADRITQHVDAVRMISIAALPLLKNHLCPEAEVQLMVNGLHPVPISMDNYLDRDQVSVDDNGEQDLESIEAIDLKLFNEQMTQLIQGQEVEILITILTGKREWVGHVIKLSKDQPILWKESTG